MHAVREIERRETFELIPRFKNKQTSRSVKYVKPHRKHLPKFSVNYVPARVKYSTVLQFPRQITGNIFLVIK